MPIAREIVTGFHNAAAALEAEEAFTHQFSERKLPNCISDYRLTQPADILTFIVDAKLATSKSEARRITDLDFTVPAINDAILKVGKLNYIRIRMWEHADSRPQRLIRRLRLCHMQLLV